MGSRAIIKGAFYTGSFEVIEDNSTMKEPNDSYTSMDGEDRHQIMWPKHEVKPSRERK